MTAPIESPGLHVRDKRGNQDVLRDESNICSGLFESSLAASLHVLQASVKLTCRVPLSPILSAPTFQGWHVPSHES